MKLIKFWLPFFLLFTLTAAAQPGNADTAWKKQYRYTATRINDLVHTKIDARFNIPQATMNGKAWITLQPHFYATDSLQLDAKGMQINQVALVGTGNKLQPLQYRYDNLHLFITLNRTYTASEKYTVFIDYVSKPNELEAVGSVAIRDAKGLYFINPDGSEPGKPTQIWTQGETEATSVWCPTIDRPNQKTTQETFMTVPAKWVTLSNGKLVSQTVNKDGTRTDYWKMELPHAPYLFFMGAGEFAVVKDSYKGKEVNYYVEPAYASVAKKIFGNTPEMMGYFSKITGVEYPWVKYSQMVGRDYVSGAMENTTATLHQETAHQNARELADENVWETTIAHELFHQWFGDLVTAESWSNITVNESFANYSQVLWQEYKYGRDAGDAENYSNMLEYLEGPADAQKTLVRFYYRTQEEVFDRVSYQKGGRILHMLRNYLGDSAFFKGLNVYLNTNKFKTGEAQQLRLAFEEVSGRDLTWFYNQWYYGSGHPKLDINYDYDDAAGKVTVTIKQTQNGNAFRLPIAIDVYEGTNKTRYPVWLENKTDSFQFAYKQHPSLVNVDADKILLCTKRENNKALENYVFQYNVAGKYADRREAIVFAASNPSKEGAAFLQKAVNDPYFGLRLLALDQLAPLLKTPAIKASSETVLRKIAQSDNNKKVKARAIQLLGLYSNSIDLPLFEKGVKDESYSVAGAALTAVALQDAEKAVTLARTVAGDVKGELRTAVSGLLLSAGDEADFDNLYTAFSSMAPDQEKFELTGDFCKYLSKLNSTAKIKKGIDAVVSFLKLIPSEFASFVLPEFRKALAVVSKAKGKEIEDYIGERLK